MPKKTTKTTKTTTPAIPLHHQLPVMDKALFDECMDLIADEAEQNDCKKQMAVFPDFEDCLLYYTFDEDENPQAVYCYEDLVESFARKNHTTYIEAVEYIDYNTMRTIPYMTHVGDTPTTPPLIVHRVNRYFTTLDPSYYAKCYSDDTDQDQNQED